MKKMQSSLLAVFCVSLIALLASNSYGQLYSQNFDVDDTANWNVNLSLFTDSAADIFFDYSTVGIPSAPNSAGGTTRGIKLQADLFSNAFGGFSVSPTGQSFTGDYTLTYDMWQNYQGVPFFPPADPFPATGGILRGAASGGTNLGYGGIMTSGTLANSPGSESGMSLVDGVWFASTGDGDSGADYRAYSSDKDVSYQPNALPSFDPNFDARELDATYFAVGGSAPADFDGSNRVAGADFLIWQRGFGIDDGTAAKADGDAHPAFAANLDGNVDDLDLDAWEFWYGNDYKTRNAATSPLYTNNFGGESPTAAQEVLRPDEYEIHPDNVTDVGVIGFAWRQHTITKVGNVVTWNVDGVDLIEVDTTNFTVPVGGTNILFGNADVNASSSGNLDAFDFLFTLVDNVEVNAIPPVSAVPEPGSLLLAAMGLACLGGGRLPFRKP